MHRVVSHKAFCYLGGMSSALPDPIDVGLVSACWSPSCAITATFCSTSPVFTVLKRALPGAEIDALVYRETAPMLEGHPAIAHVHVIDRDWKRQGHGCRHAPSSALLSRLRARRYDLIVHLTEHPRGVWLARLLAPRYAVARHLEGAHWFWRRASPTTIGCLAARRVTPSSAISTACVASASSLPGPRKRSSWFRARRQRARADALARAARPRTPRASFRSIPVRAGCSNAGRRRATQRSSSGSCETAGGSY